MGVGGRTEHPGRLRGLARAAVMALAVLAASCGGDGGDGGSDGETGGPEGSADRATGQALPAAACDLLTDFEGTQEELSAPAVFDLDEAALDEVLTARRQVLADLAEQTTGELHALLEDHRLSQAAFDQVMLDGWDQDRARLAGANDDSWMITVLGDGATRSDGEWIRTSDFGFYASMAYERLVIGCRAPELAGGPPQETDEAPPGGRLVFVRPDEETDFDAGGRLVTVDPAGGDERELPRLDPWRPIGHLDTVPTGDHGVLARARQGEDHGVLVVGAAGQLLDVVQRAAGQLACPAWNDAGDRVLGMEDSGDADDRRLHLIDLTGRRPSGPLPLPFASTGCADFVDDDRLVVSDAARDPGDDRGVWTVGVDGSDPRELHASEGCTTQTGSVAPAGDRVAVAHTCVDPLDNGLWILDLPSGRAEHVVTGHVGLPKWSPDGEWLVFGFSAIGEGSVPGVWLARADGSQLRQVVERPALTPVWLPPS